MRGARMDEWDDKCGEGGVQMRRILCAECEHGGVRDVRGREVVSSIERQRVQLSSRDMEVSKQALLVCVCVRVCADVRWVGV